MNRVGSKRPHTHVITRHSGLKTLTRSIGRKNRKSIARQVMRDPCTREKILKVVVASIRKEMTVMCSKNVDSILRKATSHAMAEFKWETIVEELEVCAPTLLSILRGSVAVNRRVRVRHVKGRKSIRIQARKSNTCAEATVIGLCAAILLRNRNVHMNLVQSIISILLNCGHASKQVCVLQLVDLSFLLPTINYTHVLDIHSVTEDATVSLS